MGTCIKLYLANCNGQQDRTGIDNIVDCPGLLPTATGHYSLTD